MAKFYLAEKIWK